MTALALESVVWLLKVVSRQLFIEPTFKTFYQQPPPSNKRKTDLRSLMSFAPRPPCPRGTMWVIALLINFLPLTGANRGFRRMTQCHYSLKLIKLKQSVPYDALMKPSFCLFHYFSVTMEPFR